jgi:predicted nucleic acid-binding protein
MYVFDATPLIYLATIERLDLVEDVPDPCIVPMPVYEEVVVQGTEAGHPDARRIECAVDDGLLEVVSVPDTALFDRVQQNDNLSTADAAVLAVAADRDGTAVMDEQYGRDVAATEGIETRGTAYPVLWLLGEDGIGSSEAIEIIDAMLEAGWYCAPDLYASIRAKIDELA